MQNAEKNQIPWATMAIIIALIVAVASYYYLTTAQENKAEPAVPEVVVTPEIAPEPEVETTTIDDSVVFEPEVIEEIVEESVALEPEIILPTLDESDSWFNTKLPSLTWRKELIQLMVTDDIIRRFVVFTDNFSQGSLAYDHAPLVAPRIKFSAIEQQTAAGTTWQWDESTSRRFSLYVDLLRSMDSDTLVQWYLELKPLIDQAYEELGYPDDDFTQVLHDAITKVLDMEIPKNQPELARPSVMYKYKDESLESLDDAEKLLLRLGKENLLVIKSVLLEINEKLARAR
ncbi:MAG: DUF3014 domain-containing protein [Cognaticolwellia sp.]